MSLTTIQQTVLQASLPIHLISSGNLDGILSILIRKCDSFTFVETEVKYTS
jgi:hypothetical protein